MVQVFEERPKQWGNSLGITIPKEIAEKGRISTQKEIQVLILNQSSEKLKQAFGTLKLKKPTQKAMDEIDERYD